MDSSTFALPDNLAVVTGGARGIGARIAAVLAEAGATVVIADIDRPGAERTAAALAAGGWKSGAVALDVADESSVIAGCAQAVAEYGTQWLLVNNAGVQDRRLLIQESARNGTGSTPSTPAAPS